MSHTTPHLDHRRNGVIDPISPTTGQLQPRSVEVDGLDTAERYPQGKLSLRRRASYRRLRGRSIELTVRSHRATRAE